MTPGRIVADKYRVVRVLGRGGMGVVAEAEHIVLGTRVAIKFLREDVAESIAPDQRFTREGKLAARLTSRHACRVQDFGLWDLGPYLVMELLQGQSLADKLRSQGQLGWKEAVGIALEVCDALGEAHALGIVHRDLKPGNVFLASSREGETCTKVLDFGVAKIPAQVVTQSGGPSLTDASTMIGTPAYVAPEQLLNSKLVEPAADIWAMGVLLYEMLSGQLPFQNPWVPKLLVMIARESPIPIGELCPTCPLELCRIVERCLEKQPSERFANAAELGLALSTLVPPSPDLEARLRAFLVPVPRSASSAPEASPSDAAQPSPAAPSPRSAPRTTAIARHAPRPRQESWWMAAMVGLGTGVTLTAGVLVTIYTFLDARPTPPEKAGSPLDSVELTLSAHPDWAQIAVDGQLLTTNPSRSQHAKDGRPHAVRVTAKGYAPYNTAVTLNHGVSLAVDLTPLPPPVTSPTEVQPPAPLATAQPPTSRAALPKSHSTPLGDSEGLPMPRPTAKLDPTNPFRERSPEATERAPTREAQEAPRARSLRQAPPRPQTRPVPASSP